MNVRPYAESDFGLLQGWLVERQVAAVAADMLPARGVVVEYCGTPIAIGFVYQTDSCLAVADMIALAPGTPRLLRRAAMHVLLTALQTTTQMVGRRVLIGFTDNANLLVDAQGTGFTQMPGQFSLVLKEIPCQSL